MASDHMVSTADYSADNTIEKAEWIHSHWNAMIASNNVTDADPILNAVRSKLGRTRTKRIGLQQVTSAFLSAYKECLKEKIEATLLAPFNMTLNQFTKEGLKRFGPENFTTILQKIEATYFESQFLICGFDSAGEPHIFTMTEIGEINIYDRIGFWAIGSGQQSALSTLFFHRYNRFRSWACAIYHVCEAKFMSETAVGVGREPTSLFLQYSGDKRAQVLEHSIDNIRAMWKESGRPRVPDDALKYIGQECLEGYDETGRSVLFKL
jgi:hypothetical protein